MQSRSNLDLHVYRYRSKFIFFTARLLSLDTLILHSVSGQQSRWPLKLETQNPLHVGFNTFMIQSAESGQ